MTFYVPTTLDEIPAADGEYRAGGTDIEARRRVGLARADTVDIGRLGLAGIESDEAGTHIGAATRIADVASDDVIRTGYPGLARTAASLANPHTRAVGTIGGNLFQRTRCWYYRTGQVSCFKTGGDRCPARSGIHHFGVVFDTSDCVAPHPSSVAMALLLYDAAVSIHGAADRTITEALGDGADPGQDHALARGELVTRVHLPPPAPDEKAAYWRATARRLAEWPLVEAACRLVVEDDRVTLARIAVGGVAPRPIRLPAVESVLLGVAPSAAVLEQAVAAATTGATPLPQTGSKVALLEGTVLEVLERALSGDTSVESAVGERGLQW